MTHLTSAVRVRNRNYCTSQPLLLHNQFRKQPPRSEQRFKQEWLVLSIPVLSGPEYSLGHSSVITVKKNRNLTKFENEYRKQHPRMQRSPAEDHQHGEQGGQEASNLETKRAAPGVFHSQGSRCSVQGPRRGGLANII